MKILVTGASGFIASEAIKVLKNSFDVIALTRNKSKIDKDIKFIVGDVSDKLPKLPKVDIILHFAGITSIGSDDPSEYFRVNSFGTYNILNKAREAKIKKLVFSSTADSYDPNKLNVNEEEPFKTSNPYTESKIIAEDICRYFSHHLGFKNVILRYSGVYGVTRPKGLIYNLFQNAMKNNPIEVVSSPENQFDSIYIKDVIKNMLKVIDFIQTTDDGFNVFNIGYGNPIKVKGLVNEILKITKSKSEVKYLNKTPDKNFCMNIEKAKKLLSFVPTDIGVSITDYYHELIDSIKRGS